MNPFDPNCEECRKRREALMARMKKMADWVVNPKGQPPMKIKNETTAPVIEKTKKEQGG